MGASGKTSLFRNKPTPSTSVAKLSLPNTHVGSSVSLARPVRRRLRSVENVHQIPLQLMRQKRLRLFVGNSIQAPILV